MKLFNFLIPEKTLKKFSSRYRNASARLREMIDLDLGQNAEIVRKVQRDDVEKLLRIVMEDKHPLQLVGNVGVGKSVMISKLIKFCSKTKPEIVFIVYDVCKEHLYLPTIQNLSENLTESSRLELPQQLASSQIMLTIHIQQILAKKLPDNFIIVLEEMLRFKESTIIAHEARKYVKAILVGQKRLTTATTCVEVVK